MRETSTIYYVSPTEYVAMLVVLSSIESCLESGDVVDRVPVLEDFVASRSVFRLMSLSCARISLHKVHIFKVRSGKTSTPPHHVLQVETACKPTL